MSSPSPVTQARLPDDVILSVQQLCKHYPIVTRGFRSRQTGLVKACDDISFDLRRGESLGVVGESGSGKTTLGRVILRATAPTSGHAWFAHRASREGREPPVDLATLPEAALKPLRPEMQMIFQDPFGSLNPRMTVQQIVAEPLQIHRMDSGSALEDRVVQMLRRVGIRPEYRTRYPHAFSGGQRQRIGIARALVMRPSLVVADEAVSALDVSVQAQVVNLLAELQEEFGLTYLFVAHDLSIVRHLCSRVAVMLQGRVVELEDTDRLFESPAHAYTRSLLAAVPDAHSRR